jgi:hypothetical protein
VGGGFWLWWRRERRRTAVIARFAWKNGYAFKARAKAEELKELPQLPLFQRGSHCKAKNLVGGTFDDLPFLFMDYTYLHELDLKVVGVLAKAVGVDMEDEGNHPVTQTVVVFPSLPRRMPEFRLIPRGLLRKTIDRVGEEVEDLGIGVDEGAAFAKHYLVEGADDDGVGRVFSARVQEYFAANPTWYVECLAGGLVIFRAGQRCVPARCEQRLEKSLEILQTLTRTQPSRRKG